MLIASILEFWCDGSYLKKAVFKIMPIRNDVIKHIAIKINTEKIILKKEFKKGKTKQKTFFF